MKKLITISLLSLYLISATELHQLTKFPLLLEHFVEHKGHNNNITFWDFLSQHYDNTNEKAADHANLPFKSHEESSHSIITSLEPPQINLNPNTPNEVSRTIFITDEKFLNSAFLSSIWQPPKSF